MKKAFKALLLMFLGLSGVAQESPAPRVLIPLVARGSHHRPVSVALESLVVTDQKTPVIAATLLPGADLPVELGILVDVSTSQRDTHLDEILKVVNQFLGETVRGPEDRVFFLKFDATPLVTGWMKKEQLQTFTFPVRFGAGTALYDALAAACKERMGQRDWRKPTRRVIVLISDGEDNLSHIRRDEATTVALRSGLVIFTIDTATHNGAGGGEKVMEYLAKSTGGEFFDRPSIRDMPKVLSTIEEVIGGMYYLTYVPPEASKSAVHEVDVKPAAKNKFELSYPRKYPWEATD